MNLAFIESDTASMMAGRGNRNWPSDNQQLLEASHFKATDEWIATALDVAARFAASSVGICSNAGKVPPIDPAFEDWSVERESLAAGVGWAQAPTTASQTDALTQADRSFTAGHWRLC